MTFYKWQSTGRKRKILKKSKKNVRILSNSMCACVRVCVRACVCVTVCVCMHVFVQVIIAYHCVWTYEWYLECVRTKIHALHDKFEVVSWMYEARCVAKVATDWQSKNVLVYFIFLYICVRSCGCVCIWWWFWKRKKKIPSSLHDEENKVLICERNKRRGMVIRITLKVVVMRHVIL